jgi:hypothetical protein
MTWFFTISLTLIILMFLLKYVEVSRGIVFPYKQFLSRFDNFFEDTFPRVCRDGYIYLIKQIAKGSHFVVLRVKRFIIHVEEVLHDFFTRVYVRLQARRKRIVKKGSESPFLQQMSHDKFGNGTGSIFE